MVADACFQERSFVVVKESQHAFSRIKEFPNLGDIKASLKFVPDIRSQSIPVSKPKFMFSFQGMDWRINKIPCRLTNIDKAGRLRIIDVIPKFRNREFCRYCNTNAL